MTDISASASIEVDVNAAGGSIASLSDQVEDAITQGAEDSNLSKTVVGQLQDAKQQIRGAIDDALDGVELNDLSFSDRAKKSLELQAKALDAIVEADLVLDDRELNQVRRVIKNQFDNLELKPEVEPVLDEAQNSRTRRRLERLSERIIAPVRADLDEARARGVRRNIAAIIGSITVGIGVAVARGPLRGAARLIDRTFLSLADRIRQRFSTVIADSIIAGGFQRVTSFLGDAFRRSIDDADIPGLLGAKFDLSSEVAEQAGEIAADLFAQGFDRTQGELGDLAAALAQSFGGSFDGIDTDQIAGLAGLQDAFDIDTEDIQEQIRSLTREGLTNEEAIAAIGQAYSELGRTATEEINNVDDLNELIDLDTEKGLAALEEFRAVAEASLGNQFRGLLRQGQAALVGFVTPLLPTFLAAGEVIIGFVQEKVAPALADLGQRITDFFQGDTFAGIVDFIQDVFSRIQDVFAGAEVTDEGGFFQVLENIVAFVRDDLSEAFDSAKESIGNLVDLFGDLFGAVDGGDGDFDAFGTALDLLGDALKIVADNLDIIIPLLIIYRGIMIVSAAATAIQTAAAAAYVFVTGLAASAAGIWAAAQAALNFVLSANPIGLIILAIAAFVGLIILAYKNSETFRNIVQGAWEIIKQGADIIWDFVQRVLAALVDWFNDNKDQLLDFWNAIVDAFFTVRDAAVFVFQEIIIPLFKKWVERAKIAFELVKDIITNILIPIFREMKDFVVEVFETWRDRIDGAVDTFREMKDSIRGFVDNIIGFIDRILEPIRRVRDAFQGLLDIIPGGGLGSGIVPGFAAANGMIVDRPMFGLVGEAGREAIIPLTRPKRALELLQESGLDKLILAQQQPETTTQSVGNTRVVNNSNSNTTNNITVNTRPGQDAGNIGRSILDELAFTT